MSKGNLADEKINNRLISQVPWGTWGESKDVAKAALFLASNEADWITGVGLPVDGGFLAN